MRHATTQIVISLSLFAMTGCSMLGSNESAFLGKPSEGVHVGTISGDLEEGFSLGDYEMTVRPITGPLTMTLARAELDPKQASKKKIHEKALLFSAIFVDGYTCFDFSVRKPDDKSPRFDWNRYRFSYGREKSEKPLATDSVPHFERQRQTLVSLLQKHLPEDGCEKKRCERQVYCGEHIHFTKPFQLWVKRVENKDVEEVASVGWSGDDSPLAGRGGRSKNKSR